MHEQPWAGIDLDDGSALFLERFADVGANDIHTANVQSCRLGGGHDMASYAGVNFVGDINGPIGKSSDHDAFAILGNASWLLALFLKVGDDDGIPMEGIDFIPGAGFQFTTAGVGVQLGLD